MTVRYGSFKIIPINGIGIIQFASSHLNEGEIDVLYRNKIPA